MPPGIDQRWRHLSAYEGKYPPDWDARKDAIWRDQSDSCARCGRDTTRLEVPRHVHHVVPLSEGGTNELGNLLGLCADCHHLRHPDNDELSGNYRDAPLFPAPDANPRGATVRKPVNDTERESYGRLLDALETVSTPTQNEQMMSDATYAIGSADARDASDGLERLLDERGIDLDGPPTGEAGETSEDGFVRAFVRNLGVVIATPLVLLWMGIKWFVVLVFGILLLNVAFGPLIVAYNFFDRGQWFLLDPPPGQEDWYALGALAIYLPAAALWMTVTEQTA